MAADEAVSERRDRIEKSVARLLGAMGGMVTHDPVLGPVVATTSVPWIEPWVRRVGDELSKDGRRRQALMLAEGADSVGLEVEALAESAGRTEGTRLLAGFALDAAQRTTYEAKVRALGRALAAGVTADDTKIDEQTLIVSALADLEVPHVVVLDLLVNRSPQRVDVRDLFQPLQSALASRRDLGAPWTIPQLAHAREGIGPAIDALLGPLMRHGLAIEDMRMDLVLRRYHEAAQPPPLRQRTPEPLARVSSSQLRPPPSPAWRSTPTGHRVMRLLEDSAEQRRA